MNRLLSTICIILLILPYTLHVTPYTCIAAELAAGIRYSGNSVLSAAVSPGGFWQGEFLAGPFHCAYGYGQGSQNIYPLTLGLTGKFPLGFFLTPYLGGDLTYYFMPDVLWADVWSFQAKAGAEARVGPLGFYAGIGYAHINMVIPSVADQGGFSALTWEAGARYYFLK